MNSSKNRARNTRTPKAKGAKGRKGQKKTGKKSDSASYTRLPRINVPSQPITHYAEPYHQIKRGGSLPGVPRLSPILRDLLTQLILPEKTEAPILFPVDYQQAVFTRMFRKVITINNNTNPGDHFRIILRPDLDHPLLISAGQGTTFPPDPSPMSFVYEFPSAIITTDFKCEKRTGMVKLRDGDAEAIAHLAHQEISGDDYFGVPGLVGTGSTSVHVKIGLKYHKPADAGRGVVRIREKLSDNSFTAAIQIPLVAGPSNEATVLTTLSVTEGSKGFFFAFGMSAGNSGSTTVDWYASIAGSSAIEWQMTANITDRSYFPALRNVLEKYELKAAVLNALGLLVTNVTAPINQAGTIQVFRTNNPEIIGHKGDLAALADRLAPNNQYDGPARYGGYAWWLPEDFAERQMTPITNWSSVYGSSNTLLFEVRGLPEEWAFKLRVSFQVAFPSPDTFFEKNRSIGNEALYQSLLMIAKVLPGCSCNPDHNDFVKMIKNGVSKVSEAIDAGVQHWEKYGPYYMAALEAAQMLAAAL